MNTRKLLAALVGLSLAAGTLSVASAQAAAPLTTPSAGPTGTVAPSIAAPSETTVKKVSMRQHHARMTKTTHRKHVSQRVTRRVVTNTARQHFATKPGVAKQLVGKRTNVKVAHHASKRIRLSHLVKRGTTKHV